MSTSAPIGSTISGAVDVIRISKGFRARASSADPERLIALSDVNLHVDPHQFVAVVGPSGCGKTTLLRIIAGLTKPDTGEVRVSGSVVSGPGPDRAVVFQHAALLPWLDVISNIAFGLKLRGVPAAERRERATALARLVGLSGFGHLIPKELSGGMQQRVGIARALAVDPEILLMDEPFSSLDEISRRRMQGELLRIWSTSRKTALFVTHSVDEAVILSDRVIIMGALPGRVLDDVTVDLPRPRSISADESGRFMAIRNHIWSALDRLGTIGQ